MFQIGMSVIVPRKNGGKTLATIQSLRPAVEGFSKEEEAFCIWEETKTYGELYPMSSAARGGKEAKRLLRVALSKWVPVSQLERA